MSKSTKKCHLFYKILKKNEPFRWSEDYEKAFTKLKEYLPSLPILIRPEDRETMFLYVAVSDKVMGIVLIIEQSCE